MHVPFTGAGPAIQSTLGGHTPIAFTALPPAIAAVKDGQLRALGVAATERVEALPDIPTVDEAGYKDFELENWFGVIAPAKTPKDIAAQFAGWFTSAMQVPDIRIMGAQWVRSSCQGTA